MLGSGPNAEIGMATSHKTKNTTEMMKVLQQNISEGRKPSNENRYNEFSVPETDVTVIVTVGIMLTVAAAMPHCTVVPLVHADVAQSTDATVAVGVTSIEAKASPLNVTVAPPEEGALLTPTLA